MSERIALCIDSAAALDPSLIGLAGETLAERPWLAVFADAQEARERIATDDGIVEAWVLANDTIEPINLAATLKADRPEVRVVLVAPDRGGSLLSRAHTAAIDEVLAPAEFVRRYGDAKRCNLSVLCADDAQETKPQVEQAQPAHAATDAAMQRGLAARVAADAVSSTFLMPVVSGSGGAGKSTIAVLSALEASSRGLRTLLLDCDLQFGDVAVALGAKGAPTVEDVLAHPELLERVCDVDGLAVIGAPARLEAADYLAREVPQLLGAVAGRFDAIVANTGAAWSECHAALLERASAALFLIDQRMSSLRACRHALDLCGHCGIATGPFKFALNRCGKGALLSSIDVSCALQGQPVFELRDGGRDIEEYMAAGAAAELPSIKNDLVISLKSLLDQLLPETPGKAVAHAARGGSVRADKRASRRGRHLLGRSRGAQ